MPDHPDDHSGLLLGADQIAAKGFGGRLNTRQIYRLAERGGWPIFKVNGSKLAARPKALAAEIERREAAARGSGT